MRIAVVGNFGFGYKGTMSARSLPIARELARRGHQVEVFLPDDGSDVPESTTIDGVVIRTFRVVGREGRREKARLGTGDVREDSGLGDAPNEDDRLKPRLQQGKRGVEALAGRSPVLAIREHARLGATIVWHVLLSQPDVVYAFKPIGYAGLALLTAWLRRHIGGWRPVLALDADDWEGTGGWADRQRGSHWRTRLVDWQERWCLTHAEVVTVASRELERLAQPTSAKLVYVPNATSSTSPGWTIGDGDRFRASLGLGNVPVVLAYTRFLEFAPGRLVEVFEKILRGCPDAHLVIAGKGLDGEEGLFGRLVAKHGLGQRVHQLGWTTAEDLPNVFAAADVALYLLDDDLLNRAKCPMKLVDLMLAGVPVVADRVGQASEYIANGLNGMLVPTGETGTMASQTIELLRDVERRTRIGAAARLSMLTDWTWRTKAEAIDEAFRSAASK